jgi:4-carboxymuconolactone decarboxylase
MAIDEEALYDMLTEVLHNQSVCDATYSRALGVFGEQGVIELVAIAGYYAMLAMVLNVGRKALPAGQEPQLPWFPN